MSYQNLHGARNILDTKRWLAVSVVRCVICVHPDPALFCWRQYFYYFIFLFFVNQGHNKTQRTLVINLQLPATSEFIFWPGNHKYIERILKISYEYYVPQTSSRVQHVEKCGRFDMVTLMLFVPSCCLYLNCSCIVMFCRSIVRKAVCV